MLDTSRELTLATRQNERFQMSATSTPATTTQPATRTATTPEEKARLELYNKLDPKVQAIADSFEKADQKVNEGILISYYRLGGKISEMLNNENVYGAGAVEKLAEYLGGWSAGSLYNLRTVHTQWTEEQIKQIAARTTSTGRHISYSHMLELSKITTDGNRNKMLERAFKDDLSANNLSAEIATKFATRNASRGGGRPPSKPHSIGAAATQVFQTFQGVENRFEPWKESLIDASKEINEEDATPELLEKLKQGKEKIETVEGSMEGFKTGLDAAIKRVEAAVVKKAKAASIENKNAKAEEGRLEGRTSSRQATSGKPKGKTRATAGAK